MLTNKAKNTIVLLGVGHTNAHIVKMWKMQPIPDAQLICVTNFPVATYSGMLPGVLSGQYPLDDMEIDLVRLCASVGVRLIIGDVSSVDTKQQKIKFHDRPDLDWDFLSIGIGSRPSMDGVDVSGDSLVAAKPMQTLLRRLDQRIEKAAKDREGNPVRVTVVGGGIGSIEISFCLQRRLKEANANHQIRLVTGGSGIGSGLLPATKEKVSGLMSEKGILTSSGHRVAKVTDTIVILENGDQIESDVVIWATNATPPELLSEVDVEKDAKGFLLTKPTLQTVSNDNIFAVGDTGTMADSPTDKAGVFAVRQGPVLWENLKHSVKQTALKEYVPQSGYLKLINTADGKSIAEYRGRTFYGSWCWYLKDRIDQKFMKMYTAYDPPMMKMTDPEDTETAMRCLGCGGKIGSQILSSVLKELDVPDHPSVVIGLANPDDAAVVRTVNDQVTVTTDFFASPFDDPYLVGRIALLNSASDCFVMGAQPTGVLAIVQLPLVHSKTQLQIMRELMGGSVEEINRMGGAIVGGHSIEGPRLTIGFTVLGDQVAGTRTKGMLQEGDQLVLTKPLGTGVLLAALMQARLPGASYQALVKTMLASNQIALDLIVRHGVSGVTDVTGFGLTGHLQEMLSASGFSARLRMDDVPVMPGCQALIESGIESTLVDDNRLIAGKVNLEGARWQQKDSSVMFDPQTSGGILCGVKQSEVAGVLSFLSDAGFEESAVIGEVVKKAGELPTIELA